MKFYLSSYQWGNEIDSFKSMLPPGSKVGHINNARDFSQADPVKKEKYQHNEVSALYNFGFVAESLNLQEYFGQQDLLRNKLSQLHGLWVSGGNTFVLRQAMRLSGFDDIFKELRWRKEFVYGGYSAGICVLCDSLKYIQHVDDPTDFPYEGWRKTIWEGLTVLHYGLLPHYLSPHPESALITKEVEFCIANKWLFKALKDGEVITLDDIEMEGSYR